MREQARDRNRLEHILDQIDKILYISKDKSFAEFNEDPLLFGAIYCITFQPFSLTAERFFCSLLIHVPKNSE